MRIYILTQNIFQISSHLCSVSPCQGIACNIDINECDSNPCSSQATCVEGINFYTCICPAGFEGPSCSVDIDECASNPCLHGGTCHQGQPSTFNCSCPPGVIGELCEVVATATFNGASALTFDLSSATQVEQPSSISTGSTRRRRRAVEDAEVNGESFTYRIIHHGGVVPLSRYRRQAIPFPIDGAGNSVISEVRFTMATTVLEGILLVLTGVTSTGSPQHVVLEIANGDLHLSANDGSRLLSNQVTISGQSTSGVINHVVQLTLTSGQIELRLNPTACGDSDIEGNENSRDARCATVTLDFSRSQDVQNGSFSAWTLNEQFFFGGVSEFTSYLRSIVKDTKGFVGCLGNLMVNGRSVNLADADELSPTQNNTAVDGLDFGCASHSPCLNTSCANGGTCQDLWLSKVCSCALGFSSERCDFQNMANFEPQSMLHFAGNPVLSKIEFYLSSANDTGLILYTLTTDSLSLSLDNGQIRLQLISYDTGRDLVTRVGDDLHLQGWVKVAVEFNGTQYKLDVTSQEMVSLGSVSGTAGSPILVTGPLFLGALHAHPALDKWRTREEGLPSYLSNVSVKSERPVQQ
ncbi:neurogenic locus notch homolog protein 1 [Elysia marginata]|uniref:Neurogenic locus notch homolog protein 1 n=1 Tax=Elysia marginata TaxID=1093978 RepID=A0AAV4GX16_9GAST|nr:neurogenic locus notch homolog protein 1 [Elysia marginata]